MPLVVSMTNVDGRKMDGKMTLTTRPKIIKTTRTRASTTTTPIMTTTTTNVVQRSAKHAAVPKANKGKSA